MISVLPSVRSKELVITEGSEAIDDFTNKRTCGQTV
jgi:hypothetical protein